MTSQELSLEPALVPSKWNTNMKSLGENLVISHYEVLRDISKHSYQSLFKELIHDNNKKKPSPT